MCALASSTHVSDVMWSLNYISYLRRQVLRNKTLQVTVLRLLLNEPLRPGGCECLDKLFSTQYH
jgi:hypothetical protein